MGGGVNRARGQIGTKYIGNYVRIKFTPLYVNLKCESLWGCDRVLWVNVLAAKTNDLSLISRPRMKEERTSFCTYALSGA